LHSLDEHRAVMAALDRIEASPIASGPLPSGELRLWAQETRALVERMRDAAEDILFEDHARLGFESEKSAVTDEVVSPTPECSPADVAREALREAVLASDEPTKDLAQRLKISAMKVAMLRREAGDACAYYSGSKLSPEQREEIATGAEPTKALAERLRISESLINRIRKAGRVF
jgi:hypothetical protein